MIFPSMTIVKVIAVQIVGLLVGPARGDPGHTLPCVHRLESSRMTAAAYSAFESLRDGRRLEIRALRPSDRDGLLAAVARASDQSFYRRFFGVRRDFTEKEIERFLHVDFVDHVALVAVVEQGGAPVIAGGARYVVIEPGRAESAFVVVDDYQGQGIGGALMRHLAIIARKGALQELVADVLPDNAAMLTVFRRSGLAMNVTREPGVVHVTLQLA
jgi:RimJ/RimL family protein N-acetyltransferase